ncbi:glycosyltransferase family 4 protein [Myroides odoratimimus]|uniref:glycosyltransferase family 4 protein n=1 Tax=Myroides odoratimimus TaxID=76832 RepID=UPI002575F88D|nr:glycosyltransferase family 4 protein [Myroides odoratimimus]MDM1447999.1 glycosyltransferase family 4 protein [Myroides odoratimimus]
MALSKKVLHITNVAFGLPYFLGDQIEYLKSNDIISTIACSKSSLLDKYVEQHNINKFEVQVVRKIDVIADLKAIFKLVKFIRQEKFDYVIGHTPKGALLAMIASWLSGTKNRIYFRHGLVFETSQGFKLKLMIFLERLTSSLATQIVNVSNSILQVSLKNGFGNNVKNIVLGNGTCNGVDTLKYVRSGKDSALTKRISIPEGNIVVGFVGRLVNDKGINELVEAWKLLVKKYNNITLLLVGPFEERDALSNEVISFINNEESIIVTGFVNNSQPYYNVMDIFILPSYREGFPTVVLEASSMKLPIITTKSTGCVDSIKENMTGIFTTINSIDIKDKIEYYIENYDIRLNHGKNGRVWIEENFKQETIWKEIKEKVYNL